MRGSEWIIALQEEGELSPVLRKKWASRHGDPVDTAQRRRLFIVIAWMLGFCALGGILAERYCPDWPVPWLGEVFTLLTASLFFPIFRTNTADVFFAKLKAFRDLTGRGYEKIARMDGDQLSELARELLNHQHQVAREKEILKRLSDSGDYHAREEDEMKARDELAIMDELLADLEIFETGSVLPKTGPVTVSPALA